MRHYLSSEGLTISAPLSDVFDRPIAGRLALRRAGHRVLWPVTEAFRGRCGGQVYAPATCRLVQRSRGVGLQPQGATRRAFQKGDDPEKREDRAGRDARSDEKLDQVQGRRSGSGRGVRSSLAPIRVAAMRSNRSIVVRSMTFKRRARPSGSCEAIAIGLLSTRRRFTGCRARLGRQARGVDGGGHAPWRRPLPERAPLHEASRMSRAVWTRPRARADGAAPGSGPPRRRRPKLMWRIAGSRTRRTHRRGCPHGP